jgi:outer membrane beta-barrel protein
MKRLAFALLITIGGTGGQALAQQAPGTPSETPESATPGAAVPAEDKGNDPVEELTKTTATGTQGVAARAGWDDIVVVPRKAFLKDGRVELNPFTGVSLNDALIRHYSFGGDLNYFLTDVLSIGLQGQYYLKERTDRAGIVGLQYNRIATLNRYKFAAALNFGYVPGYGKFSLFNRYIIHWEMLVSAGVGFIRTEIIPRDPSDASFQNDRIAPNFGVGTRLFLNRWLTFNVQLRDYVFSDKFEPRERRKEQSIETVKANAESRFVHNVMLYAGIGLYLPTSFQYRTPR